VPETIALASVGKKIRRVGHRFHSTCNHDGTVTGLNRLRRKRDCFQSRAANLVYSHGTYFGRQAAEDRSLARGILSEAGGNHIAHDAFVDLPGLDPGALYRFAHHDRAELRRAEIGKTALKFSYRGAAS